MELSHILVRHENVPPHLVPFTPEWHIAGPAPKRSIDDALTLAESISTKLKANPQLFEAIAREQSEDVVSAPFGGALGPRSAMEVLAFPAILDTLGKLAPGGVSDPIPTTFGFHILKRQEFRPTTPVSGRRLILGHHEAPWLRHSIRQGVSLPERTTEEAMAAAQEIVRMVGETATPFSQLVHQHSEHWDADERLGDIGTWYPGEPTALFQEVLVLRQLEVGEVSQPVHTFLGLAIVQRTQSAPRAELAARVRSFPYSSKGTREEAFATATQLLTDSKSRGSLSSNTTVALRWQEGKGPRAVATCVRSIPVGSICPNIVEAASAIHIVQRVPPSSVPPPAPPLRHLPRPAKADPLRWLPLFDEQTAEDTLEELRRIESKIVVSSAASQIAQEAKYLEGAHQGFSERFLQQTTASKRKEVLEEHMDFLKQRLGTDGFTQYAQHLETIVFKKVMAYVLNE